MLAGYEQRERELWRWSLLLLVLLATAVGALSLKTLESFHPRIQMLPLGVILFIVLVVGLVARKKREVDRMRAAVQMVHNARTASAAAPSDEDSERLLEIVQRSQRGYRALIDSFDDAVFAVSLDGEILAANRRFAETMGLAFPQLVGHRLHEFLSEPDPAEVALGVQRFLDRRHWAGIVRMRLKTSVSVRFFDCERGAERRWVRS